MKQFWCVIIALMLSGCVFAKTYSVNDFAPAQQPLVKAVQKGDIDSVEALAAKTDMTAFSNKGVPILSVAMYEARGDIKSDRVTPRLKIITALMKAGADASKRGEVPESPLTIALAQEHPAFLRAMLEGGLDPNYKDGGTAIIFDITDDYKLESLKLLVEWGADINIKASNDETLAHLAIVVAPKAAEYLIAIGADIHSKNKYTGMTFLEALQRSEFIKKRDVDDVKNGRYKGNLDVLQGKLNAIKNIKTLIKERGEALLPEE